MKRRFVTTAAVLGAMATTGRAQLPAIPAAPAVPAVAAPAVPAVPSVPTAAPAPRNIWSFFMLTPDQKAACAAKKAKFCVSPMGQLLNNVAKPVSAITGGLTPGCCPPSATDPLAPNPDDLKKPATEAEGAAARIKELEAGAAKRRAAVRYLGTVNCKRFPEAETALIGALRTDTNECVRFEAAMALAHGCCCSAKTVKALTLTVDGTDTDGNPPETSARVRAMAAVALARCCGVEDNSPAPKELPPELPPERPMAEAKRLEMQEREKAVVEGRKALAAFHADTTPGLVTGRRTVVDTLRYATALAAPAATPVVVPATAIAPPPAAPVVVPAVATMPAPTPSVKASITNPPTGRRGLLDLMWAAAKTPDR